MGRYLKPLLILFSLLSIMGVIALTLTLLVALPRLPATDSLRDVRFQVPLSVHAADGALIAEFGTQKRLPVDIAEVPELLKQAIVAAEDDRFYSHSGVDFQGLVRAAIGLIRTGERRQGGSTITMQVARNFYLSREKTFLRKGLEILLALKIERDLSKDQILELYINKIFLGQRAYGFGAAAQVYYGCTLAELTLPQIAMLAGLPKAPSSSNPVANLERALLRRNYVLGRMAKLHFISPEQFEAALAFEDDARVHGSANVVDAPHVAERVRRWAIGRYGDAAYTAGYQVHTTLDSRLQGLARDALRSGLNVYDRRHGYRGAEGKITGETQEVQLDALDGVPAIGGLRAALVSAVSADGAELLLANGEVIRLNLPQVIWARAYLSENRRGSAPKQLADVLQPGDLVRVSRSDEGWQLAQVPDVNGALISLEPRSGRVLAMVGGYDFSSSPFDRATQARRQPGSNFKPFIYAAALAKGYTAASLINDAPVVFEDAGLEDTWRPENYSRKFYGPTRLRMALAKSRNLVSVRLLRQIGPDYALSYVERFGFDSSQLPQNLSLALGSGSVTPLELAAGYAVIANGGYRVQPSLIDWVEAQDGSILFRAGPGAGLCNDCEQTAVGLAGTEDAIAKASLSEQPPVISPQVAYLIHSMLTDVIRIGTGRRVLSLGRSDLAGKTGTTNDQKDAWFSGYHPNLLATVWVGFDQPRPLGARETGGGVALPIWMEFMGRALAGQPESTRAVPPDLLRVRIDPDTGLPVSGDNPSALFEYFRPEYLPELPIPGSPGPGGSPREYTDDLF
ncbi:MAG: penicillin-binding protein 1A [Gammaproteobacteria bacterium]|nr:penicillin-binding protein 1A [Gammaproteobacteria bacterium]